MERAMAAQFEREAMHYRREAVLGSISTGRRVPPSVSPSAPEGKGESAT